MTSQPRRTYVLDTNVLIADPNAIFKFEEHDVIIPAVVIKELEGHKTRPDTGYFGRKALHLLEDLRQTHGTLREWVPLGDDRDGRLKVELNHIHDVLPPALNDGSNDARILTVALNLKQDDDLDVVLVTKDLAMRLNADVVGLEAERYLNEQADDEGWTGLVDHVGDGDLIDRFYTEDNGIPLVDIEGLDLPVNGFVRIAQGSQSVIARLHADKVLRPIDQKAKVANITGRSTEQRALIELLRDDNVKIVSASGAAGSGKSLLTLGAALDLVRSPTTPYRRVVMLKPAVEVTLGAKSKNLGTVGYLKGGLEEKIAPYKASVDDSLEVLGFKDEQQRSNAYDRYLDFEHFGHIRGRTFRNCIVIMSEVQSLETNALLALLTRVGEGARIFLEGDVAQSDNPFVEAGGGITAVKARLKAMNHPQFGHITLSRVERSDVAELIAQAFPSAG